MQKSERESEDEEIYDKNTRLLYVDDALYLVSGIKISVYKLSNGLKLIKELNILP